MEGDWQKRYTEPMKFNPGVAIVLFMLASFAAAIAFAVWGV